jgi:hypothetical protein
MKQLKNALAISAMYGDNWWIVWSKICRRGEQYYELTSHQSRVAVTEPYTPGF